MAFLAPRIAPGIGVAMARVAARFFFFSILLVGSTIYLPHEVAPGRFGLIALTLFTVGMIVFLHLFPWDRFEPRVFTLVHLLTSCSLLSLLVFVTGGARSSYDLLFFLIILFSYFYNLREMLSITTVVSIFYLLPFIYSDFEPRHVALSAVTVLFFYLGTYVLYGVTRFVLKKNRVLQELNTQLSDLYEVTSTLLKDMEKDALLESLSESLKDHLPSTYCMVMLFDDKANLTTRIACPVRTLTWEPAIGSVYAPDALAGIREVLETRQPKVWRLETDEVDQELRKIISRHTRSLLVVPIRIAAENVGVILFGEERQWERAPFNNEQIQLAVAIGRQVAVGINMWWCYERLVEADRNIQVSHDRVIKAERLAALGEVTRAVEHEINNPLNVIVNWAELYREDEAVDPELRNKFSIIYDMALRIREVIIKLSTMKDTKSIEFTKDQKMTDLG
ncbi:MAG TPA: hypothetical protein DCO77_12895 [Nitrospiraceae bacterium]|nr:hypothetical protein [Nitrospiraceae bacterium]